MREPKKEDKSSINLTIVLIATAGALAVAISGMIVVKDNLSPYIFQLVLVVLALSILILIVCGFFGQKLWDFSRVKLKERRDNKIAKKIFQSRPLSHCS